MSEHPNPPAFPSGDKAAFPTSTFEAGMSLRDYFAVHADQPGVSEIVAMAGHHTDGFWVEFADGSEKLKFNDWWNGLPLTERFTLTARVRFGLADAMLGERARHAMEGLS